ncbi:MAG: hypothetical protein IRY83_14910 [Chloroflexi bacterium]|nr:hypothetical protein [Chloroflexota bacterium]
MAGRPEFQLVASVTPSIMPVSIEGQPIAVSGGGGSPVPVSISGQPVMVNAAKRGVSGLLVTKSMTVPPFGNASQDIAPPAGYLDRVLAILLTITWPDSNTGFVEVTFNQLVGGTPIQIAYFTRTTGASGTTAGIGGWADLSSWNSSYVALDGVQPSPVELAKVPLFATADSPWRLYGYGNRRANVQLQLALLREAIA